jgi:hypothetical protein
MHKSTEESKNLGIAVMRVQLVENVSSARKNTILKSIPALVATICSCPPSLVPGNTETVTS